MTGYLTAVGYPNGRQYELRIPNMEVRQIYMEQVLDWFKGRAAAQSDKLTGLYEAFESGSADAIKEYLDEQLLDGSSIDRLTSRFSHPEWTYPAQENYDFEVSERFPWGSVTVLLRREGGMIRAAKIFSDAMEAGLFPPIEEGLIGCPFLIGAIGKRFDQKLAMLRDPRLIQIAGDVCTLIC